MDGSGGYYAMRTKSDRDRERQIPDDFTYIWKLKNKINKQAKQATIWNLKNVANFVEETEKK